eukprot:6144059-Karenia_brevis.AAC.1
MAIQTSTTHSVNVVGALALHGVSISNNHTVDSLFIQSPGAWHLLAPSWMPLQLSQSSVQRP